MQRREFLAAAASGAAVIGMLGAAESPAAEGTSGRQIYELRTYHFASMEKLQAYSKFMAETGVPALNRAGVQPVGVFRLWMKDNAPLKLEKDPMDLYVLLPHASFESVATLEAKLGADEAYQQAGRAVLLTPQKDPAYARYDSSLLYAFEQFPTLQVPSKSKDRLMQLRRYESHSNERALKKLEMFQQGGELGIFNRVGMTGVFFGQALAGDKMPNLSYMLGFDDEAAMKKGWDGFRADADWKKLSKDERYKDTVSTITNLILRPEGGSQI